MKAKDTQNWLRALRQVCQRPEVQAGDVGDIWRMQALDHLCQLYDISARAAFVPSDADAAAAGASVEAFLLSYTALARWHLNEGRCLYNFTIKFRLLHHVVHFGRWISPRAAWCYEWEDFVGKIKQSTIMAMAGTEMAKIPCKLMQNYLLVLQFDLMRW